MLQFMRKHAKFFYIFFFLVIISFIFFYVGPVDRSSSLPVIVIGDEMIYPEEYWRSYDNLKNFYRSIYQDKFDEEMEKSLNIKDRAISILLTNEILYVTSKKLGIIVTNEELTEDIMNDPSFLREGVFIRDIYLRVLQLNRMTPQIYETRRQKELIIQKVRRLIENTAIIDIELPDDLKKDEKTFEAIRQRLIAEKKEKIVQAYIEAIKKNIPIKIRYELIA